MLPGKVYAMPRAAKYLQIVAPSAALAQRFMQRKEEPVDLGPADPQRYTPGARVWGFPAPGAAIPGRTETLPDLLRPVSTLIRQAGAPELFLSDPHGAGFEKLVSAAEDWIGPKEEAEEPEEVTLLRRACAQYRALRRTEALRILGEDS
jgi:hypothetical protein